MSNQEILTKAINLALAGGWKVSLYDATELWSEREIIFDHDFAKALWGEDMNKEDLDPSKWNHYWQHHLQQMVIADDPIAYLGDNL